ncbi:MAG: HNH endonuclease [bacterium]
MKNFELKLKNNRLTDTEIVDDTRNVALKLSQKSVSINDYNIHGRYNVRNIEKRFGTWNDVLKQAGLEVGLIMNVSDEELFRNLETVWTKFGRQPTRREIKQPNSKYSTSPYTRRFGSWNNALQAFVDYINSQPTDYDSSSNEEVVVDKQSIKTAIRRTSRSISDRLRFRILMRDGFTCAKCGRSPLKERDVELHVDHIKPWSKGGETIPENLETKCSKCNLGKGNAFNV